MSFRRLGYNRGVRCAWVIALLAAPVAAQEPAAEGLKLDEVVAVVEGRAITLSELEWEARVALVRAGGLLAAEGPLDGSALRAALDHIIAQHLAYAEAERLRVFEVTDDEVTREIAAFRAKFSTLVAYREFLNRQDMDEEALRAVLARDLRVARYLEGRLRLAARVRDAELDAFYESKKAEFGGQPPAAVRETLRAFLTERRFQQLARDLLADLRKRGDVRIVAEVKGMAWEGVAQ
jgi:hypothetical protein